jgi:NADPH-dependent curcumin reductase CurA
MENHKIVLAQRPQGLPAAQDFRAEQSAVDAVPAGGVLIKNHFLSIDPAMRGWICDLDNYLPAVAIDSVMRSLAVGEVVRSDCEQYAPGDQVTGWFGWQHYAAVSAEAVIRKVLPEEGALSLSLGVLGLNGITASLVLRLIGKPQAGETVLVSTAAGGVGSIVGQLAKRAGCRVIGLTGADDKVERCVGEFGYDVAINYKSTTDLQQAIKAVCPDGVDVYLDSVGGPIADAAIACMNINGRIIQCGTASIASWDPIPEGPRRERYILTKRLLQQGFVVFDHLSIWPEVIAELAALVKNGELTVQEDIRAGLAAAPAALEDLYTGSNNGKTLVAL